MGASPDRREELLAAAARVMGRAGFDRMRLRDVADEAGVSIGLLQHYFETREQLGREVFAAVCGDRAARFAEVVGDDVGWEPIERCLRHALAPRGLLDRSRTWIELCAAGSRDPELRRQAEQVQAAWRAPLLAAIEGGVRAGELQPAVDPRAAADLILALIDGAEIRALIEGSTRSDRRVMATAIEVARAAVGAR